MLWVKTIHIFCVMAWMAGVFYVPRIFVHCAEAKANGEPIGRLLVMAEKLIYFITPFLMILVVSGMSLWLYYDIRGMWLYPKLGLVVILIVHYAYSFKLLSEIKADRLKSPLFYRIYNEAPVFVLFGIIYFVVFKCF